MATAASQEAPLLLPTAEMVAPTLSATPPPLAGIPLPTGGVLRPEAAPQATGLMLPGGGAPGGFMPTPFPAVAPVGNDPFALKPLPGLALPGAPLLPPLPMPGMPAGFPPLMPGAGPAGFGGAAPLMPTPFGIPATLPGDGMMGSGEWRTKAALCCCSMHVRGMHVPPSESSCGASRPAARTCCAQAAPLSCRA